MTFGFESFAALTLALSQRRGNKTLSSLLPKEIGDEGIHSRIQQHPQKYGALKSRWRNRSIIDGAFVNKLALLSSPYSVALRMGSSRKVW